MEPLLSPMELLLQVMELLVGLMEHLLGVMEALLSPAAELTIEIIIIYTLRESLIVLNATKKASPNGKAFKYA
jgi:hypothetical protein